MGLQNNDILVLTQAADFLIKYGFLAVGLFLFFVVTPLIYKVWKADRIGLAVGCSGLAFIIVFGVINLVQTMAPSLISSHQAMIRGVVLGLKNGYHVQMRSDRRQAGQAYIKRENDPDQQGIYNYPFILVTAEAPTCLAVALSSTDQNSENSPAFNVTPISPDDMASNVQIVVKAVDQNGVFKLQVWRERRETQIGSIVLFEPLNDSTHDCGAQKAEVEPGWRLIQNANAQAALPNVKDLIIRLQSDDVFARRDARIELSRLGAAAFGTISQLLDQDNYRVQVGAVSALADIPEEQRKQMPHDLRVKVRALLNHSDKAMRDTAVRALGEPAFCYQEEDKNKSADQRYLALCQWSNDQCETTRGPNTRPGIRQSACASVDLTQASWNYATKGFANSWYQFSPTPFKPPFPQIN